MALAYSMDKIGPISRSAEDCDLVLKIIAGHDPQDLGSLPEAGQNIPARLRKKASCVWAGW